MRRFSFMKATWGLLIIAITIMATVNIVHSEKSDGLIRLEDVSFIPLPKSATALEVVTRPMVEPIKYVKTYVNKPTKFHAFGESYSDLVLYEFDFEGDGIPDWRGRIPQTIYYSYPQVGEYRAVLKVYDIYGRTAIGQISVSVESGAGEPEYDIQPEHKIGAHPPEEPNERGDPEKYALIIGPIAEERFWTDIKFAYYTLRDSIGLADTNIFVYLLSLTLPDDTDSVIVDYYGGLSLFDSAFNDIYQIIDGNDEFYFAYSGHGTGYRDSGCYGPGYYGGGPWTIDPTDLDKDFPESEMKYRVIGTDLVYSSDCWDAESMERGMYEWEYHRSCSIAIGNEYKCYRTKVVAKFPFTYIEDSGKACSDLDIFLEEFTDFAVGDTNKDGFITYGSPYYEVADYDDDDIHPIVYDADGDSLIIDEDDWGNIDKLGEPSMYGGPGVSYVVMDLGSDSILDIDILPSGHYESDGQDTDNNGIIDYIDLNDDGDLLDTVAIDEHMGPFIDDEWKEYFDGLDCANITFVAMSCMSGGMIDDLSRDNMCLATPTYDHWISSGNTFIRRYFAAIGGKTYTGVSVPLDSVDSNEDGCKSVTEIYNYAATSLYPCYDDNADHVYTMYKISSPSSGEDGYLGFKISFDGPCDFDSTGYMYGDADSSQAVNILDITYLTNFLYKNGPAPKPLNAGDPDQTCITNVLDIVYLINFIYNNGPDPIAGCIE